KSSFFAIKNARGPSEMLNVMPGNFNDATFRREIAFQNDQTTRGFERIFLRAHHLLSGRFSCGRSFFCQSSSGDGYGVSVEKFRIEHTFGDKRGTSCGVEVRGEKTAAGFEVGDDRNARADAVEVIDGKRDLCFVGDGQKVQDRVGRAAGSGDAC